LWDIQRKKGETDEALNARMDATRVKYDTLKQKIAEATGATGAYVGVVGGATQKQQEERDAILGKISAIDLEIQKELARQAVESLTPEMFGTGAAAAAKYAEAKRGLMLATGMVTQEGLAEQDAIRLLSGALASGQIAPDQYAQALGRVKSAAADGKVSLGELMSSPFFTGGTKFALKNADEVGQSLTATIAAAKTQMTAAGADLAAGVTAGIQSQSAQMGGALTGSVDAAVLDLLTAYQMQCPSLVMAGMGMDLGAGLAQGVAESQAMIDASLQLAAFSFQTILPPAFEATAASMRDSMMPQFAAFGELLAGPFRADLTRTAEETIPQIAAAVGGLTGMMWALEGAANDARRAISSIRAPNVGGGGGGSATGSEGGAGSATGVETYQTGGMVRRTGLIYAHAGEGVFTPAMMRGSQALPREMAAAMGGGGLMQPAGPQVNITVERMSSELDIEALAYRVMEVVKRRR
jgi:hypothetical protein